MLSCSNFNVIVLFLFCFCLESDGLVSSDQPLDDYFLLTLDGYSRQRTSKHEIYNSEDTFSNSPTFVRMLEGRMFVVGPKGCTIGSGKWEVTQEIF